MIPIIMNTMKLFRKDDKVKIQSRFKEYEVIFEDNKVFLKDLVSKPNSEIVVDKNVYELYKDCFEEIPSERLFVVEATEKNKVVDTALDICEKITEIPAKRNATLISIGGGIIQDITGLLQMSHIEELIGYLFQLHFWQLVIVVLVEKPLLTIKNTRIFWELFIHQMKFISVLKCFILLQRGTLKVDLVKL